MLIVQISDCHVAAPSARLFDRVATSNYLRRAISAINSLPREPNVVLVTGDLVDNGREEEYEEFKNVTSALRAPILPVVGNHDDRTELRKAFELDARFEMQTGFIQYTVDTYPLRLLIIDTTSTGSHNQSYCDQRLEWLAGQLSENKRPTLVAMHHPPFSAGVEWMESPDRTWAKKLLGVISGSPNVVRMVCGHVHRTMTVACAGTIAMAAPSTAHQVYPALTQDARPQFNMEAPGFLMHHWNGSILTSYGVSIPGLEDTFGF